MKRFFTGVAAASFALLLSVPAEGRKPVAEQHPEVENIVLMVGDGMGLAQVSALMLAEGYAPINIERAVAGGFVKTYSANNRVTDSAAAGTAFATGEKTDNGHLGVGPGGEKLTSILEKAEKAGLATGLVITTTIQHATPGAFYAHNPNRDDAEAISLDLVASGVDVAIGGGRNYLTSRKDGRNLMTELGAKGYVVAETLEGLDGVSGGNAMALYDGDFPFVSKGRSPEYLSKATGKALEILTANSAKNSTGKGFFLMVEGSHIDHGGHENDAEGLLGEMRDFDRAVGVAFDYADTHPGTLVVVLADHETGGLTLPSGKEDFLLPDSGVKFAWSTGGHSATMIPMFLYGTGAESFGVVMDNTEVNHRMTELLRLE